MSEPVMPEEPAFRVLEEENVDQAGYIILPYQGDAYISRAATKLFETLDEANGVYAELMGKGMPLGYARVVEAKLMNRRKLEVRTNGTDEAPRIISPVITLK